MNNSIIRGFLCVVRQNIRDDSFTARVAKMSNNCEPNKSQNDPFTRLQSYVYICMLKVEHGSNEETDLVGRDINGSVLNSRLELLGVLAVHVATNTDASTKNLQNRASHGLGERLVPQFASDLNDIIQRDGSVVLDILHLLAISWWLLQSLDDHSSSRGYDLNGSLSVLHSHLNGNLESFPILGSGGDIITDLLRGETQRTDLRG